MYLSAGDTNILIDAGCSAKQLELMMKTNNLDASKINAIILTHEHADHVRGVRVLASRYGIKVYSSRGTLQAIDEMALLNGRFPVTVIENCGREIAGNFVVPFRTSHDSKESVGYIIDTVDNKRLAIVTDLGYVSDEIREKIDKCNLVVIESNHDIGMVQNGDYPYHLKRRILSKTGHLSNTACAAELPGFAKKGTTKFLLTHLSQENNIPDLAYQTSLCALKECGMEEGKDFQLYVAPKQNTDNQQIIF